MSQLERCVTFTKERHRLKNWSQVGKSVTVGKVCHIEKHLSRFDSEKLVMFHSEQNMSPFNNMSLLEKCLKVRIMYQNHKNMSHSEKMTNDQKKCVPLERYCTIRKMYDINKGVSQLEKFVTGKKTCHR